MATHARVLALAPHFALLFALVVPAAAGSQEASRDSSAVAGAVKDLPLTASQRQAFVGSYSVTLPHGEQKTLRVFEDNGVLKGEPEGQNAVRLLYQGDNVFRPEGIPGFVFTFVVENGRATKLTGRRPDGVMEGIRRP